MGNVEGRIAYCLSEGGRRASLKAGGSGRRNQEVSGLVSSEDVDLFKVDCDGRCRSAIAASEFDMPLTWQVALDKLREEQEEKNRVRRQELEERGKRLKAEGEQKAALAAAFIIAPERYYVFHASSSDVEISEEGNLSGSGVVTHFRNHPYGAVPNFDDLLAVASARFAQQQAEKRAVAEAEATAKSARAQAETDFIEAWVREHGSTNQQQRYAADLLPRDEVLQALEDAAFRPLDDLARYAKLKSSDVCPDEETCAHVTFASHAAESASAAQWDLIRDIAARIPEAEVQLRAHAGDCQDRQSHDLPEAVRHGVMVHRKVGPFTMRREYAAPQ